MTVRSYQKMTTKELLEEKEVLEAKYREYQEMKMNLDMSRGKPDVAQLELSMPLLDVLDSKSNMISSDGLDCRNYGGLDGIKEAKVLFGEMLSCSQDNVIVYGNSSLSIMYDTIARSYIQGVLGSKPWCQLPVVKFLCPVPGYDRHFAITEHFGIEMINIPMLSTGPDMDLVERLVAEDDTIKGIWCVPKYSNPQGISYSDETVRRLARLQPMAGDFRIYWDNAYAWHHLDDNNQAELVEIIGECEKAGNPDLVYQFCSTSKVTFPGSGIAAMSASIANLNEIKKQLQVQTISHDKINQLRHVRFFKNLSGVQEHMRKHADILRPKFNMVCDQLDQELAGLDVGEWVRPNGGYFVCFEALEGCASAIVAKAKSVGLIMTPAGAMFPYGKDAQDSAIRIAPSFLGLEDLELATKIFVLCVKLTSIEKYLEA